MRLKTNYMKKRQFIDILDANEIEFMFSDNSTNTFKLLDGEALRLLAFKKQNPKSIYWFEDKGQSVNLAHTIGYRLGGWKGENGEVLTREDIDYLNK